MASRISTARIYPSLRQTSRFKFNRGLASQPDIYINYQGRPYKPGTRNVYGRPLAQHSTNPPTGFYRDGYCDTGPDDYGLHIVAAVLSEEFLDFTASRGNDLRPLGLTQGCKWCLCAARWMEAFLEWKAGKVDVKAVPQIDMEATGRGMLKFMDLDKLEEWSTTKEKGSQ